MKKEIWKPIFRGWYEVSNLGRVRRARAISNNTFVGKICRLHIWGAGYLYVHTIIRGKVRTHLVHKLVARAFLGPCPRGKEVNHKDLDKTNPRLDNLEYRTRSGNVLHAIENGVFHPHKFTLEDRKKAHRVQRTPEYRAKMSKMKKLLHAKKRAA